MRRIQTLGVTSDHVRSNFLGELRKINGELVDGVWKKDVQENLQPALDTINLKLKVLEAGLSPMQEVLVEMRNLSEQYARLFEEVQKRRPDEENASRVAMGKATVRGCGQDFSRNLDLIRAVDVSLNSLGTLAKVH